MKHLKLFENFEEENLELQEIPEIDTESHGDDTDGLDIALELANKMRLTSNVDKDQFLISLGIKPNEISDEAWKNIEEEAEEYNELSDDEFFNLYDEYKKEESDVEITEGKKSGVTEALKKKSKASGIPMGILRKVFAKGMQAWNAGHRPGVAQHQWAFGRVNSFITGAGGARKADAALWSKAKAAKARKKKKK